MFNLGAKSVKPSTPLMVRSGGTWPGGTGLAWSLPTNGG